jgi:DNA-binding FrmR family transcriptional regulator
VTEVRLHHVQVACPPGGEDDARRFYGEGLGLTEVEKPAALTSSDVGRTRNCAVDSTLSGRGPSLQRGVFLGGSGAGVTQADAPTSTGTTQVVNRIKRAQGQLSGVLRMLEEGRDLQEIVNQLKAVSRALDRAGFAIIANELRESARKGSVTEEELDQLERFFLSLA